MGQRKIIEKYKAQSTHYIENAIKCIEAGEAEKAGEFVWGSMAQALKAVAAKKDINLYSHWDIKDYARGLAKELGDESITTAYALAESLHCNFYESGLRVEDVQLYLNKIKETIVKLLGLVEEEKVSSEE